MIWSSSALRRDGAVLGDGGSRTIVAPEDDDHAQGNAPETAAVSRTT
jgi:hypothetical protein